MILWVSSPNQYLSYAFRKKSWAAQTGGLKDLLFRAYSS